MPQSFPEYERYDGLGLAELVRKRAVAPAELCEAAIARAEIFNPQINAIIYPMYELARAACKTSLPAGPFQGVPFLLKDLLHTYQGVPMSHGSAALKNFIPDQDSELVRRFKQAGVVIFGKTNTPEFGLMGVTEPKAFGPTRNPWNLAHTSGGSSGGSGAAVAARIVPLASASDGGGSIRIPSSCCGLFGLKPTRGRTPVGPYYREVWSGASVDHVVSVSVRDSAAMLDATQGGELGAPYQIARPVRPYLEELGHAPGKLRIGFASRSPLGQSVHPECVSAVENTAKLLESLGHSVEEAEPRYDGLALAKAYFMLYFGEMAADLAWLTELYGKAKVHNDVEDVTQALALIGRTLSAGEYVTSLRRWKEFSQASAVFHQTYDIYLTPTLASPPLEIGALQAPRHEQWIMKVINALGLGKLLVGSGMIDKLSKTGLSKMPFTQLANLTGQPAMSVPLHWTAAGLPCGVQFVARYGEEHILFRLAAQLEQAQPWFDKRPPLINV